MSNEESNAPVEVSLKAGKEYYWCACGKSATQPFCDGAHKGTAIEPLAFTAEKTDKVWLCNCKRTKTPPFCDGSHND